MLTSTTSTPQWRLGHLPFDIIHLFYIEKKMFEVARLIIFIQLIILSIIIVLAWIYILPIIFIRRLHTVTNILTCNVCLVCFLGSLHWIVYRVFDGFYSTDLNKCILSCTIIPYFQTLINCLMIYAFLMITINRFFLVTYPNKRLFKRLKWCFISFVVQWLLAIILPLPYFTLSFEVIAFTLIINIVCFFNV